ncbi:MAG TPA: farnesyl diphosphate synthase [Oscillospiraceae bacterium]|nr:farnesyl diphosphate synthase [Oscillospiraceae bacterium]
MELQTTNSFNLRFSNYIDQINDMLVAIIRDFDAPKKGVSEAMQYSLDAGGKRIRPVLLLEFCRVFSGSVERALPVACAVELIHTYTLIHDDLPCMDNDDYRRGRLSCHKVYGEAYAILAGDAMQALAYEMLARVVMDSAISTSCVAELAKASGIKGLIGGQELDLASEGKQITVQEMEKLHSLKTGALIKAACKMGSMAAGSSKEMIAIAGEYGEKIGLMFQIVDDILDVEGDRESLGKLTGSDAAGNKCTYVSLMGLDNAKKKAQELANEAISLIENLPHSDFLKELTLVLLKRTH